MSVLDCVCQYGCAGLCLPTERSGPFLTHGSPSPPANEPIFVWQSLVCMPITAIIPITYCQLNNEEQNLMQNCGGANLNSRPR